MSRYRCVGVLWPLVSAIAASGCAGVQQMDLAGVPTFTAEELRTDQERFGSAFNGGQPVVVRLRAGDRLPANLAVATPVFRLQPGDNAVLIERDLYLYITRQAFLVSPDGERWVAINNMRGLQELFDLHGGTFRVGFGVNREVGPSVNVELRSTGAPPSPGPAPSASAPEASAPEAGEPEASEPAAPPEPEPAQPDQPEADAPATP